MMGAMGFEELKSIVETCKSIGKLAYLPPRVRSDALAKLCWIQWEEYWDIGPWHVSSYDLMQAKTDLLKWIEETFEGGRAWASSSDFHEFKENSPEFGLHQTLDRSNKFALASRYLHSFVVRGEPKLAYRKRSQEDEYYQLTAGPLGAYDDEDSPALD
jgi:hypothetical protein